MLPWLASSLGWLRLVLKVQFFRTGSFIPLPCYTLCLILLLTQGVSCRPSSQSVTLSSTWTHAAPHAWLWTDYSHRGPVSTKPITPTAKNNSYLTLGNKIPGEFIIWFDWGFVENVNGGIKGLSGRWKIDSFLRVSKVDGWNTSRLFRVRESGGGACLGFECFPSLVAQCHRASAFSWEGVCVCQRIQRFTVQLERLPCA